MSTVRIKEVAKLARVSTATVSHVINKTRLSVTAPNGRFSARLSASGTRRTSMRATWLPAGAGCSD
ncbi:MAG: hypothetical protein DMG41_33390 [Acidobacteria bacterium]|nr:MAG: hypothetical protein DMG42_24125 [Acidobacteriota bacterium]PYT82393.1 MAG: hypothetical protein DMG41_33390 [Acidobacteriota bacterium]